MSTHVLPNLLNKLGRSDKMQGLLSILSRFRNKFTNFNNAGVRMLNSINHMTQSLNVRKRAKIRNRYNQAPHLTQDTNGKVTTSQLDTTNESQEVSPFPVGDHKASTNRRASKHKKTR